MRSQNTNRKGSLIYLKSHVEIYHLYEDGNNRSVSIKGNRTE